VRIIGHRGAAARAPENTLAGIRRAFADGADAVEVDVRLTADSVAVIVHDESLARVAGLDARVADLTAAEVRAAATGDRGIPTLIEAWEAAGGRIVLEIKGAWGSNEAAGAARAVAAFLDGRDVAGTVVSCFDVTALDEFRAAGGTADTGVLTGAPVDPADNIRMAVAGGHQICYLPVDLASPAVIRQAHAAGKAAVVWTVNDPAAVRALADAGADGIITDDPAAARAALG